MDLRQLFFINLLFLSMVAFTACDDNGDDDDGMTGEVQMEITDSPIDDENVEAVFVTIADVKVDGESWDGFNGKMTINLLAYQNGQTQSLGRGDLETGTYSNITLVLDNETDASGNSPGTYVMTTDGDKEALSTDDMMEVTASESFTSEANQTRRLVIDFDMRKAITYESGSTDSYQFVTQSELNSSLRVIEKNMTGTVTGNCTDGITGSDKIVVYAYKKGTYDDDEWQGQGSSNIRFKNAVTSSAVSDGGTYQLSFLENGDYELHFVAYEDDDGDGASEIQGTLLLNVVGGLDLETVSVTSGATITLNVVVTGIIPI